MAGWGPDVRGCGGEGLEAEAAQDRGAVAGRVHLQVGDVTGGGELGPGGHERVIDALAAGVRRLPDRACGLAPREPG